MKLTAWLSFFSRSPSPPWNSLAPIREDLFGVERLEQHALSLAAAQQVTVQPPKVTTLHQRLNDNANVLLAAYRASATELVKGHSVVPAAEWLLDNYHLVEEQIREIRDDLPPGFYRQLPKLADGHFAGYPRVFGLAWAFIAHTDSHFDVEILRRFLASYQRIQPLTIGELWAVAITLRIVLIENLRRLVDQITLARVQRADADELADKLLVPGCSRTALEQDIAMRSSAPLCEPFAAQLAKRLRDQDPRTTPALEWLAERLKAQGSAIDEVVQHALLRQGASNLTVRNIITSMRLISAIDWSDLFESVSVVDAQLRAGSQFAHMDFPTRNLYRSAIEQLARRSSFSELEVTELALAAAQSGTGEQDNPPSVEDAVSSARRADPGYHLIAEGRFALEQRIGFRPPLQLRLSRFNQRLGIGGYLGSILLLTLVLITFVLSLLAPFALPFSWLAWIAVVGFLPATEVASTIVNRLVTRNVGTVMLPGLELKTGVPTRLRTLVAVPTLLTSERDLLAQIEQLEVHHLSGQGGDLSFALLVDGLDADQETVPGDAALLASAQAAINALNLRYGPAPCGQRFWLFHRRRLFNASENTWMAWERKRGKLCELNALLRGARDTSFIPIEETINAPLDSLSTDRRQSENLRYPENVRYVVTLDADTRLPRDTVARLIGKMAHPLNQPRFDQTLQRVVGGYGILQPRVTPALPVGSEGSLYQRVFSSPGGIDPYAAASSDVYQDLFEEGSYTGKGIYDLDAFSDAMAGRVPENTLLSHDLFEGIFARAGLASDVEVIEDFPARYDVAMKRQHRWTRGDWQLIPWILGFGGKGQTVPTVGRCKMLDNIRRSLLAPAYLCALALVWLLPLHAAITGTLLTLAALTIPIFLPTVFAILPHRTDVSWRSHLNNLWTDLVQAVLQLLVSLVLLADQSWRMGDAIVRTLIRLVFTRRLLLEWTTAAQSNRCARLTLSGFYRQMWGGLVLALVIAVLVGAVNPELLSIALPFVFAWFLAPLVALRISQAPSLTDEKQLNNTERTALRLTARRTWHYFETFVTPLDNMLPPDNFQEDPKPVIAHRTSPTNMGLYLLACVAARDFGWASTGAIIVRLQATLATMEKLARHKGHFYNWYDTLDLRVLEPAYISSVDSGNLAGHLIVLANACEEWRATRSGECDAHIQRQGLADTLALARAAIDELPTVHAAQRDYIAALLLDIEYELEHTPNLREKPAKLLIICEKVERLTSELAVDDGHFGDALFWIESLNKLLQCSAGEVLSTRPSDGEARLQDQQLVDIATQARRLAMEMNFAFLLDAERKLLSIGYSQQDNRLDPSCYDLLASEARLASLFAIAKGDADTRHWFHLGRAATPLGTGSALISWSGSMFEYLMPSLVMRAPRGSLLEQTNRLIVKRQQAYGATHKIPWGISESAYNARDMEFTYQYANFGVPGLGLKRGLAENLVIAPYATGLATMVDARAAVQNYARLTAMGALGRYGFFEALDFTAARLPKGSDHAIVRNFMAHHQGMTIVAIANTLDNGSMRRRFHREPMIQACELLLQERLPRNVAIAHPRAEEVKTTPAEADQLLPSLRRFNGAAIIRSARPITHLLSNGRYAVMLTGSGAGYSRWRNIAITRWREDATRDDWGSFVFLRDTHSGNYWSACAHPPSSDTEYSANNKIIFGEDHAEYKRRDGSLTTHMEILVSGEDDGEVRRLSLVNNGHRSREIELTSYAELVLTQVASDSAHQAFAKLFVQTEFVPESGALIATRRPRAGGEAQIWAAHIAVIEGESVAELQYETDRARFFGMNRKRGTATGAGISDAAALLTAAPLSNTVGTVLDPIFSLRACVKVPAGETVRVAFWTLVASSRDALLDLIDKHHDRNAFERAKTLAWTQAQVQLRHLGVNAKAAADFQQLTAPILYNHADFRASSAAITRGAGAQAGLWPHAISGDLPIVLLRIDDIEDLAQVRQLLLAHEYWRMKRLDVDLVIINERASSYVQDLHIAIETAVRSSQARPHFGAELGQGSVYVLRADLMTGAARALIQAVARVELIAHRGALAKQLALQHAPSSVERASSRPAFVFPKKAAPVAPGKTPTEHPLAASLEFFNGLGGFANNGREYVTILRNGDRTPAPWINVIANPHFGFQVSAEGSGYTWADSSRENQLTPWSNDPVKDPSGEAIYICDQGSGAVFTATAGIRDGGEFIAHHGRGYSRFEHEHTGIALDLLQYVPLVDPIKISRLTLTNRSDKPRRLTVTAYNDWVLGNARGVSGPFISTEIDSASGALLAHNRWNSVFAERVAFADMGGMQERWTADRSEFWGRTNATGIPAALHTKTPLSGNTGAGLDPCAALQCTVDLAPGETRELVIFLGQCLTIEAARDLVARYRAADLDAVLAEVTNHWDTLLGSVQVKTPDRAMDIMLNGWLLYQTLACRIWARSAFYQASGAYGFRDQLQDGMALTFSQPALTRSHLLRAASRQFVEGDVQHWWLPHTGQGVRTRISDDRVWLSFATATYILSSGDSAILDEPVTFLSGQQLAPGEHDAFFQPMLADESASLFEHCARGLDQCLELTGELGLPLMGTGDWNDGMNRVGQDGKGESVWLGWLLVRTIELLLPHATTRDPQRAERWRAHSTTVVAALENSAWDGDWYRRATFDDGTWLGSKNSDECRIDSIAQSWAVLSEAANPERAQTAMASVEKYLIRKEEGLALLFMPPFNHTALDPGYIKGYPPGLRENGGQYSHAAMWVMLAFAKLGQGDKAVELFSLLNPINHARTPTETARYKVEPYAVAADVYSVAPHSGRGGWTWYTGAAGWMYRAGVEGILGIRRESKTLVINPCIPKDWPGYEAVITVANTRYQIKVINSPELEGETVSALLDGELMTLESNEVRVLLDGGSHILEIQLFV